MLIVVFRIVININVYLRVFDKNYFFILLFYICVEINFYCFFIGSLGKIEYLVL